MVLTPVISDDFTQMVKFDVQLVSDRLPTERLPPLLLEYFSLAGERSLETDNAFRSTMRYRDLPLHMLAGVHVKVPPPASGNVKRKAHMALLYRQLTELRNFFNTQPYHSRPSLVHLELLDDTPFRPQQSWHIDKADLNERGLVEYGDAHPLLKELSALVMVDMMQNQTVQLQGLTEIELCIETLRLLEGKGTQFLFESQQLVEACLRRPRDLETIETQDFPETISPHEPLCHEWLTTRFESEILRCDDPIAVAMRNAANVRVVGSAFSYYERMVLLHRRLLLHLETHRYSNTTQRDQLVEKHADLTVRWEHTIAQFHTVQPHYDLGTHDQDPNPGCACTFPSLGYAKVSNTDKLRWLCHCAPKPLCEHFCTNAMKMHDYCHQCYFSNTSSKEAKVLSPRGLERAADAWIDAIGTSKVGKRYAYPFDHWDGTINQLPNLCHMALRATGNRIGSFAVAHAKTILEAGEVDRRGDSTVGNTFKNWHKTKNIEKNFLWAPARNWLNTRMLGLGMGEKGPPTKDSGNFKGKGRMLPKSED